MHPHEPDLSATAIVFNSDGMGQGDDELRQRLAGSYLRTLQEGEFKPAWLLFYADGVKLVAHGSACRETLTALSAQGTRIIACRTCLEYHGLMENVPPHEIGNMLMILEAQAAASKVITL